METNTKIPPEIYSILLYDEYKYQCMINRNHQQEAALAYNFQMECCCSNDSGLRKINMFEYIELKWLLYHKC